MVMEEILNRYNRQRTKLQSGGVRRVGRRAPVQPVIKAENAKCSHQHQRKL